MKKLLLLILSVLLIIPVFSTVTACKKDELPAEMTFAVLSDIHLQVDDENAEAKYRRAVEICREKAGGKLDAIVVPGDLIDTPWWRTMYLEDGEEVECNFDTEYGRAQMDYMVSVIDDTVGDSAFLYCLGNHDMGVVYANTTPGAANKAFYDAFAASSKNYFRFDQKDVSDVYYSDTPNSELHENGIRYAKVGRTHFITMTADSTYGDGTKNYNTVQMMWLEGTLKYLASNHKSDPVFLFTHPSVRGTVTGSENSGTSQLNNLLKAYPQVVTITGHIHSSEYNECALNQDLGFTCVDAASVKYTENTSKSQYTANPYYANSGASSQGLLVTVKPSSEVIIRRMDFTTGNEAGPAWVIPAVGNKDRHKTYLTEPREENNKPPVFADDATVTAVTKAGYLNVNFPAATDADNTVYGYNVTAVYNDNSTKMLKASAAYGQKYATENYCVTFENAADIKSVYVVAVDNFGLESTPISAAAPFNAENITQPAAKRGVSDVLGGVTMGNMTITASDNFKSIDGGVSSIKSMRGMGGTYFNGYGTDYEFSYNISNMRLNRASTVHGVAQEAYRLGATLAVFPYNGRIYSICASFDFGYIKDLGSGPTKDEKKNARVNQNKLSYYLLVSSNGAIQHSKKIELNDLGMPTIDLGETDYKSMFKSAEGATLKVQRTGNTFKLYVGETLVDTKSVPSSIYHESGILVSFDASTVSAFGVGSYGAEAVYTATTAVVA